MKDFLDKAENKSQYFLFSHWIIHCENETFLAPFTALFLEQHSPEEVALCPLPKKKQIQKNLFHLTETNWQLCILLVNKHMFL